MRYLKPTLLALTLSAVAAACGDTYRYPCQNPANARKTECICNAGQRTKNKALGVIDTGTTTTTIAHLVGFDC